LPTVTWTIVRSQRRGMQPDMRLEPTAPCAGGTLARFGQRLRRDREAAQDTQEVAVHEEGVRTTFAHPTPELPVEDVERAQQHYRDALGFEIGWLYSGGDLGAVSRDDVAIFFRRRKRPFEPAVHWVFAADLEATYRELSLLGARIVEPLDRKPWGLRQFTVEDIDGNRFYFHCD
jgi:predicted enzyme related to lactoylglutathione lyase